MATTIDNLVEKNRDRLGQLEKSLDYHFSDLKLLQQALIHSSFAFEQLSGRHDNETLEFLGDAVLDLTVGYILFTSYPEMREGKLTRIRSALVNETGLAHMARKIDLGKYLCLGRGENASNGREKPSILSCGYEAIVGALFMDGGYGAALEFVKKHFQPLINAGKEALLQSDAKSHLQEWLQEKFNEGPRYVLEKADGPAHARSFTVSVWFRETNLGTGHAGSKKEAEQRAAAHALRDLDGKLKATESADRQAG